MAVVMNWLGQWGALRVLKEARALLDQETPLKADCGRLCGGACCQEDQSGANGMLLFPFEQKLYCNPIEGFPFRLLSDDSLEKGGWKLVCEGRCLREYRPLGCRIFPLRWKVKYGYNEAEVHTECEIDPRAWAVCPLPDQGRMNAFNPGFVKAVQAAGDVLVQNIYMLEFLLKEQKWLDEIRKL